MARKKGIVKQISNYGEKHPYVTLALAGTFGYYLYENMIKVQPVAPLTEAQRRAAFQQSIRDHEKGNTPYQYDDLIIRQQMKMAGLGATTSTSTTSSSSHRMPGPGDGEPSIDIPEGSCEEFQFSSHDVRFKGTLIVRSWSTICCPILFLFHNTTQERR